jgi:hypothetical protein
MYNNVRNHRFIIMTLVAVLSFLCGPSFINQEICLIHIVVTIQFVLHFIREKCKCSSHLFTVIVYVVAWNYYVAL